MFPFKFNEIDEVYAWLAFLRVFLTLLPQNGYVHPDEFFQSVEVLSGNSFDLQVNRPWEFNVSFPIRSIVPQYATVGFSYFVLKAVNHFWGLLFDSNLIMPYFLLIAPRLLFCALSFTTDECLRRICATNNEKFNSRRRILATSYVILIYGTRTFTNTIELVLFNLLLYYVSESIIVSGTIIRQSEYISSRKSKAKTIAERAQFHKLSLLLRGHSLRHCPQIAAILAIGFFNRPTFPAFALIPVFFWLYRGIGFKSVVSLHFHLRMLALVVCTIPWVFGIVFFDSLYYGYISFGEIGMMDVSLNSFVVTPLNFLKYNINASNLAEHGLHPRYLHTLVNVPLLFNVVALVAFQQIGSLVIKISQAKFHHLPTVRSIKGLMTASFLAPIALLSVFPHQEPRFLIPILLPLVYLYGHKLLPEEEVTVKPFEINSKIRRLPKAKSKFALWKIWLIANAFFGLFYGFVHQAGVVPFVGNLAYQLKTTPRSTEYHVVTSHIYMMPQSILMAKIKTPNLSSFDKEDETRNRVTVYEKGSARLDAVLDAMEVIVNACRRKRKNTKVLLALPSSLEDSLNYLLWSSRYSLVLKQYAYYFPHVSIEAVPNVLNYYYCWMYQQHCPFVKPSSQLGDLVHQFGLVVYEAQV